MTRPRDAVRRRARFAMSVVLVAALTVFVTLLARGWGGDAFGTAAGVLLLGCLAVCVWTAIAADRSARAVDAEVARLRTLRSGTREKGGAR